MVVWSDSILTGGVLSCQLTLGWLDNEEKKLIKGYGNEDIKKNRCGENDRKERGLRKKMQRFFIHGLGVCFDSAATPQN
jgi:hypothetical protein